MYANILRYEHGRYAWYALALFLVSAVLFSTQDALDPPSGSTWQGYGLGGLGGVLVVWLTFLGMRKRRYGTPGRLEGWVSAHVYFGISLVGIVLLHSAGQVGWNVHGATLALMIVVVISGVVGSIFYVSLPAQLAEGRKGRSRAELFSEMAKLDAACLDLAARTSPSLQLSVRSSINGTTIGGGVLAQLVGADHSTLLVLPDDTQSGTAAARRAPNRDQGRILAMLGRSAPQARTSDDVAVLQELVTLVARRQELLRRIRRDIQLQSMLGIWLFVHVPFSIALLASLICHITIVFLYW